MEKNDGVKDTARRWAWYWTYICEFEDSLVLLVSSRIVRTIRFFIRERGGVGGCYKNKAVMSRSLPSGSEPSVEPECYRLR